jgi:hypothetical protein
MNSRNPTLDPAAEAPRIELARVHREGSRLSPDEPCRIHVLGCSGTGATLLGVTLAEVLHTTVLDTESFNWMPNQRVFQIRRRPDSRRERLLEALQHNPRVIVCGSVAGWGQPLESSFDLVIALVAPRPPLTPIHPRPRSSALRIDGRSQRRQDHWVAGCSCPVLQLDASLSSADRVEVALRFIRQAEPPRLQGLISA